MGQSAALYGLAREINVILVTEFTRWGRAMLDLFHTLQDLQSWEVSLVSETGLQFDLRSAQGKLIASLMAALAEFEGIYCASGWAPEMPRPASAAWCSDARLVNA